MAREIVCVLCVWVAVSSSWLAWIVMGFGVLVSEFWASGIPDGQLERKLRG